MLIALIILMIMTVILSLLLFLHIKENRNFIRQLERPDLKDSNALIHTEGFFSDSAELAKRINELMKMLRAQQIDVARKGERMDMMLANISHDLRTPLTSALGYIDMLNENPDMPEDEVRKELEIVEKRLHRLSELIDAFFEFSKLISAGGRPEQSDLSIVSVLEESIAHYYDDFNGRGRSIVLENGIGRTKIKSNRNMLLRIFDNLCSNAYKHGRGNLSVKTEKSLQKAMVTVRFINPVDSADIDTEHIFDAFYTRDISRTGGSTGLGLAIAKEFTQLLGGSIRASVSAGNLEITIELPG